MKTRPPRILIITPARADSNNGNWRTARRWADLLSAKCRTAVTQSWQGEPCDGLIALHARRSARSISYWAEAGKPVPLALCLTGTDLYSDIGRDPDADRSLELADRLVVLQEDALQYIPVRHRSKTQVIYQSSKSLSAAEKASGQINCVMVGHIRHEKDPMTALRALKLLPPDAPVRIQHIGSALDQTLAAELETEAAGEPRYHWTGPLPHGLTRAAIKRAHLLLHPSVMEGGANVIVEAITSGTPVLASEMSGNIGMLGKTYPGYFPVGDAAALAGLLMQALNDANFRARLANACSARAKLFAPAEERRRLEALVFGLISD
ncbi:MAG: selenoneine biosynthesis selenosugar synthase SenB [Burkholderiales bacterium]|nr:selenoneine biosynthesis selenosugar synthase SenB [Burkholderiales bacterium]